jgi:hypothetical protein
MPVGGGGSGPEGILQPPVESLHLLDCGWYAVVGEWLMLSRLHRAAHKADVNWAPLSEVMVAGTPNLEIQLVKRALAQSAAVMAGSGIASGHRDVLSMTVNR